MKRPNLKRVKKSADAMLGSLDSRVMKADFKANLKTVKKEEEKVTLHITSVLETPEARLAACTGCAFSSFARMCCI